MTYHLRTFGPPSLTDERGDTPPGLGAGKPLAVLCYLAREGEVRRETVAALLWGEASEAKARNAFRQALHRLRAALGEEMVPHDPDTVRIAAGADLRVDAREFERALSEGRPEDAVELVTGEFLAGFTLGEPGFDHWADGERARLRRRFLGALREAARRALAEGRVEEAVAHASRLAREDPLDSSSALLETQALTAAGRMDEAGRLLDEHAGRYRAEVGEDPPEDVAVALAGLRQAAREERESRQAGARETGAHRRAGAPSGRAARAGGPPEPVLRPGSLNLVVGAWRDVAAGDPGAVLVAGEAGSGKTWLVDEVVRRVRPLDRPLVLRGAERMGRHGLPYAPVAEALRGVLRARGLAGASTHLLAEAARLVPELRDRFDLPVPRPIADETGRLRFFEGVASVLDAVAYEQPVLLVLESLHGSDPATLDLIHFLVSRLAATPLLLLMTGEPERGTRELGRRLGDRLTAVVLEPVPSAALEALLEARVPELGPMARAEAAAAAGGNPRRAWELARRLARGESIATPPVPFEAVARARMSACTTRERRVLLTLALLRRPLSVRLVAGCSHLPEGAVLESIEPLRRAGLVRDLEDGLEVAEPAVADAAASAAGPAARALLAGWAVDALSAERAATDGELAALAALAGRREEAARYAEAAGRGAATLGATGAAAAHFREALGWTSEPGTRARLERLLAGVGGGARWLGPGRKAGPSVGSPGGAAGPEGRPRTRALGLAAASVVVLAMVAMALGQERGRVPVELPGRVVRDTLVLVRTEPDGDRVRLGFTGPTEGAGERRPLVLGPDDEPRWTGPLRSAGLPALTSPDGRRVAIEAVAGDENRRLLAVSADRSDTLALAEGREPFLPLAWAPDASRLLYRVRRADGGWDLRAVALRPGFPAIAVDTGRGRIADEAAWAPDGTRIAWTARTGPGLPRDLHVAFADGSAARNLTRGDGTDPGAGADVYHIAWAPGGERVAFTSDRAGNVDIFAAEVLSGRIWRLTWDAAHDDHAAFSPDGAFLAFESTRGGEAAVYVMASWGGEPVRVSGPGQRVSLDGWRGYPPPTLSHFRFRTPPALEPGEQARLVAEPIYDDYVARHRDVVRWSALDPHIVELAADGPAPAAVEAASADTFLVARAPGLGRIAVSAGGWREDTVWVKVGRDPVVAWRLAESDIVGFRTAETFPTAYGLQITVHVGIDGDQAGDGRLVLALASPLPGARPLVSLEWDPGGGMARFAVDREERIERAAIGEGATSLGVHIGLDGHVSFLLDGENRWRSSLRLTGPALPMQRAGVTFATVGTPPVRILHAASVTVGALEPAG